MTAKLLWILVTVGGLTAAVTRPMLEAQEQRGPHLDLLQAPAAAPEAKGAQLFRTYCATCHGRDAQGDGPLASRLRHAPPNLTNYSEQNRGVFPTEQVFRIIDGRDAPSHGDREMPVWGDAFQSKPEGLTPEEARLRIEAIVGYLRAIQRRDAD